MQPSICYIPFSFTIKHVIGHTSTVFKRLVPKSAGSSVCWNGCNGVWWVTICNSKLLLTHRLGEAPCLLQVSQHRSLLSSNSPFLSILLTASLVTLQGAHPVKRLSEWERCQRSAVHLPLTELAWLTDDLDGWLTTDTPSGQLLSAAALLQLPVIVRSRAHFWLIGQNLNFARPVFGPREDRYSQTTVPHRTPLGSILSRNVTVEELPSADHSSLQQTKRSCFYKFTLAWR